MKLHTATFQAVTTNGLTIWIASGMVPQFSLNDETLLVSTVCVIFTNYATTARRGKTMRPLLFAMARRPSRTFKRNCESCLNIVFWSFGRDPTKPSRSVTKPPVAAKRLLCYHLDLPSDLFIANSNHRIALARCKPFAIDSPHGSPNLPQNFPAGPTQ